MKIAIAQINPVIGDFHHNFKSIYAQTVQAKKMGCELVVFSELVLSGYPPRDLLEKKEFVKANLNCLKKLIKKVEGIGVICGYIGENPENLDKPLFNSGVLFENGRILHITHKRLLPTYDVFDERRHFAPGTKSSVFYYKGLGIGLTICEDAWNDKDIFAKQLYPVDPVALLIQAGADLIINISASVYHMGKNRFRSRMLSAIAKKYQVPLIFCNQVGGNDSVLYDGISTAFKPNGDIAAQAKDFEPDLVVFDSQSLMGDIHPISSTEKKAVEKALIMGIHDYVIKCGFSTAVVGLSGGIDSAMTLYLAVRALGKENVTAIFMPSAYTSRENFEDTKALADNLGVELSTIPIDEMFKTFLKYLVPDFKKESPGITEQNIQARIRGTLLMGFSNKHGCMVLSTGNKSELAVGYCTLYGDMNGGLAVISDLPKTLVYDLANLINQEQEIIPARIITKPPSAELKPDQTDQDDLPPYEIIDPILKGYIEEAKGIDDLVKQGHDPKIVADVIKRVDQNEYKRNQAAPGLKITSKAFGEGRRYPIAKRLRPV